MKKPVVAVIAVWLAAVGWTNAATRRRLERLITEAGRVPVLRDTLYRTIEQTSVVA